jgi:Rrf2 family protein
MKANTQFVVSIHILTLLAYERSETLTSDYVAASVNTNPVVVRRLLGVFRRARIVSSTGGPGGGWRLERPAAGITLRDVYRVAGGAEPFPMHSSQPSQQCPVGRQIQGLLAGRFQTARDALEEQLEATSIEDLVQEVRQA